MGLDWSRLTSREGTGSVGVAGLVVGSKGGASVSTSGATTGAATGEAGEGLAETPVVEDVVGVRSGEA